MVEEDILVHANDSTAIGNRIRARCLGCHAKKLRFHVRLLRKGGNKILIDSPDQMSDRMRIDLEGDNG